MALYCHNLLTGNDNFYDSHYFAGLERISSHISLEVKNDFQYSSYVHIHEIIFYWHILMNEKEFFSILLKQGMTLYHCHN